MVLADRSLKRLEGVHPDLVRVVKHAASLGGAANLAFVVTEGLRSEERQKQLVAAGASWTMKSRHLTGHAVDLAVVVAGEVRWDWPLYDRLGQLVKHAADDLQVPIEWGGDWTKRDGPHFQLAAAVYPSAPKEHA